MRKNFTLVSLIGALFCFFLPWLEFKCTEPEMKIFTQTGVQAAYGGASIDTGFDRTIGEEAIDDEAPEQEVKRAPLVIVALCCLLLALFLAVIGLKNYQKSQILVPVLGLVAALSIAIQIWLGFPIKEPLVRSLEGEVESIHSYGFSENTKLKIEYQPWIYLTIALLILPLPLALRKPGDKRSPKSEID